MAVFDEEKQKRRISELRHQEEEDLASILSRKYGVGYIDLSRTTINTDALRLIKEQEAREAEVVAFGIMGKKLSVAARSPHTPRAKEVLQKLAELGYETEVFMVSGSSLERAYERYKDLSFAVETKAGVLDISGEEVEKLRATLHTLEDARKAIEDLFGMNKAHRISRILETVLAAALSADASDVHVEPEEEYTRLRFRLDGVLTDILTFDRETYQLLLSRIKLLSGLKLNIKNAAQDGRFSVHVSEGDIEIRTSILPGAYGESIVLRLLNPTTIGVPFENLGIEAKLMDIITRELKKPNGMILTTGPTGAGKTTTLYAFLKKIHQPGIKIITIEDPIEYHLPGIVQTQVDKKVYTFASGLRSALRQDPDVIMIGEIRDGEVATTAINASLTGHLVFSTLHTNNAAGAFPRLIDLGVNPKVISSAVTVVMAQRLVRKLCDTCRKKVPVSKAVRARLTKILDGIHDRDMVPKEWSELSEAEGCSACGGTGFQGRIGIFEAITMDSTIERMVKESASERDIGDAAHAQGILTLLEDGVLKVIAGVTSLAELERVIEVPA